MVCREVCEAERMRTLKDLQRKIEFPTRRELVDMKDLKELAIERYKEYERSIEDMKREFRYGHNDGRVITYVGIIMSEIKELFNLTEEDLK